MKDLVRSAWQWLADSRLARGVVDRLFRSRARRRLAELDEQAVARCQNRTLLGLVHKARGTRFGRDHDFRRIRTPGDFRRLVPLRTPAELWREYWQPAFPDLAGATWPGPLPYLAISSAPTNGPLPYIPVSPDLWAAQQTAALTALAFVLHARPHARLCAGRLVLVESGTTLVSPSDPSRAESIEAMAVRRLPLSWQPYAVTARPAARGEDRALLELAERSARLPVTCLAGTADRLQAFLAHVRRVSGRERLAEIWPQLAAVLYARGMANPDRAGLAEAVGSPEVLCLEMYFQPEGAVALEDPRHGGLRLLPDHGVYFEFVPVDQLGRPRPARYTAAEVQPGVPYALAVSSPAGVWACLVGSVVRFERRDPPLLRLVETRPLLVEPPVRAATPAPHPYPQPPHPRSAAPAAGPPGRPGRSAWSARGDRG